VFVEQPQPRDAGNAFQRNLGERLEKTRRAPDDFAARSCTVRPALSNTTTAGRSAVDRGEPCDVLRVGESSQSCSGNSTASRKTALRLTRK
jgi:hypothetical protein